MTPLPGIHLPHHLDNNLWLGDPDRMQCPNIWTRQTGVLIELNGAHHGT